MAIQTRPRRRQEMSPNRGKVRTGIEERPQTQVAVRNLRKRFRRTGGEYVNAIDGIDLDVNKGEIVVLLGPSGCGKTTLLRCIAGLESPSSGEIAIAGKTIYSDAAGIHVPPERRNLTMMFQSYAVWPHMTVGKNVEYPLKSRNVPKNQRLELIKETLNRVGIPELIDQYPGQLSGGQQQRVALARCLVVRPSVILFDEPLSNVDAKVRERLRIELLEMQRTLQFSALYVTHDQEEAMQISDKLAVLREGKIVQVGPCKEVYRNPSTRYVANFVGSTNEWIGNVEHSAGDGQWLVSTALGPVGVSADRISGQVKAGADAAVVVRPEDVRLSAPNEDQLGQNEWCGTVTAAMFLGSHTEYIVTVGDSRIRVWKAEREALAEGTPVRIELPTDCVTVLPAEEIRSSEVLT